MANEIVPSTDISEFLARENVQNRLMNVVGTGYAAFTSALIALVNNDPALLSAFQNNPNKFLGVALKAANYNLPIGNELGFAYIIPFKGQAQFIIGYKGLIQLVKRSGKCQSFGATDVRDGEIEKFDPLYGNHEFNWCNDIKKRKTLPIVGYVASLIEKDGFKKSEFMTIEEIQKIKGNSPVWNTHFDSMAKKTVIRRLLSNYATIGVDPDDIDA